MNQEHVADPPNNHANFVQWIADYCSCKRRHPLDWITQSTAKLQMLLSWITVHEIDTQFFLLYKGSITRIVYSRNLNKENLYPSFGRISHHFTAGLQGTSLGLYFPFRFRICIFVGWGCIVYLKILFFTIISDRFAFTPQ